MIKRVLGSFSLAFQNIRSHFFHTILSIIGIVIGVAALVAILSLIDGMEQYARDQISNTTSLKSIIVRTDPFKRVNGVRIKKDTFAIIDYPRFKSLRLGATGTQLLHVAQSSEITADWMKGPTGAVIMGIALKGPFRSRGLSCGVLIDSVDIEKGRQVAIVNSAFALAIDSGRCKSLIGKSLVFQGRTVVIQGVLADDGDKTSRVYVPITLYSASELIANPPELSIEANLVEEVPKLKEELTNWLHANFLTYESDFSIITNEMRVKQAAQGFLLFRVIMGLIVGISVLVGGIGVMNVLLISVTERTVEIGIRKATGASKSDIVLQFLCESITVSALGSVLGLIVGVLGTMTIIPIVNRMTELPFQAIYTWNTFFIVATISLVIGIAFGTYPALRASRLDPVDAIRRE